LENILAIESSGPWLSVALACRKQSSPQIDVLCTLIGTEENRHAEDLPSLVDALLQSTGLAPCDITGLVIGDGPGSFTGLRIGFSFAQGWCWSGTPLNVLSTYASLGHCALTRFAQFEYVAVLGDARRNELFCAVYTRTDSRFVDKLALGIRRPEEFVLKVEEMGLPLECLIVVTRTACEATGILTQSFTRQVGIAISSLELGEAQALCEYSVLGRGTCLSSINEISSAVPCYVRSVAALKISERSQN
jgi:tRNA threonylcarbamoyl adenosine modification protein YeaZ